MPRPLGLIPCAEMEAADWASLSDEELLERRISKLGLRLEGTALEPLIRQLYDELSAKGLVFHPPCHIGDEWFVPVGIPAIFVPFFLVHDRLRALERTMMLEVEGGTPEWFMKLIRHEAAHAYSYAYHLPREKKWQQSFGQTSREETPDFYRPRPFSRSYVVHLDDWYAQSHPDEDFAETFAVWLTPELDWRKRYAGWKALQKLEYVDELMRSLGGQAAGAHAGISRRRLRLSEPQAQDLLRAQTEALRGYVSGFLRCRSAAALSRGTGWHQGQRLSAPATAAVTEFGLPMDERKEIPGEQTSRAAYRPLRSARTCMC